MLPKMPWYDTVREKLVPTEQAANYVLVAVLLITIVVLIKGNPVHKAAWAIWLILP